MKTKTILSMRLGIYFLVFFFYLLSFEQSEAQYFINTSSSNLIFNGAAEVVINDMNITNSGTATIATTSSTFLTGTTAMVIDGNSVITFGNLTINKSSGASSVNLITGINVATVGTFILGNVVSSSSAYIVFNAGSSVSGASDVSHVNGPVKKVGSTNFTYPVGNATYYREASTSTLSASETYTVQYIFSDPRPVYGTALDPATTYGTLNHITAKEYWTIDRAASGNAFVTLSWNSNTSGTISAINDLVVTRWNTSPLWFNHGGTSRTGTITAGTVTNPTTIISSFNTGFTLGSTSSASLPIELLNFYTECNTASVNIQWVTGSESNNNFFVVEKSADGITFNDLEFVKGAGYSESARSYSVIDYTTQKYYYRLRQTDFDGKTTKTPLIISNCNNKSPKMEILSVQIDDSKLLHGYFIAELIGEYTVQIYNNLGAMICDNSFISSKGINIFYFPVNYLSSGIYYLHISLSNYICSKKFMMLN